MRDIQEHLIELYRTEISCDAKKQSYFVLILSIASGALGRIRSWYAESSENTPPSLEPEFYIAFASFFKENIQKIPLINQSGWKNTLLMTCCGFVVGWGFLGLSKVLHSETLQQNAQLVANNKELKALWDATRKEVESKDQELNANKKILIALTQESEQLVKRNAELSVTNERSSTAQNMENPNNPAAFFSRRPRQGSQAEVSPNSSIPQPGKF